MAGSRKWFKYTTDDQIQYAVQLDESNAEATDFDDLEASDGDLPLLPKGFQMRYGVFKDPDSGANRRIWIGKPDSDLITGVATAITLLLSGEVNVANWVLFFVTAIVGERRKRAAWFDTGLIDGDQD